MVTTMLENLRKAWASLSPYERFERLALGIVQILLAVITVYAIVLLIIEIASGALRGPAFMERAVLQETFGSILTVLILLEFNHSVHAAVSERKGALQVRIVVLIAIMVVARKLMLLDYASVTLQTLLGFSALVLALGAVYWLLSSSEERA
jgi:uncharacterized membrane protein (DUF373 family)